MPTGSPERHVPRVGYVLKKFPRLSETFILDELLALEAAGVALTVVSLRLPDDGRFQSDLARLQAPVHYLPPVGGEATLGALEGLAELGAAAATALRPALDFVRRLPTRPAAGVLLQSLHLARAAVETPVDHLHAHFMTVAAHTTYLAHLFTGIPFTVTAHAKDIWRRTVEPDLFREVAGAATAVVTVCDANRRYLEAELLQGVGRVERVYTGIERRSIPPPGSGRDPDLVLAAGRLVEKKGFHVLLDAARVLLDRGVRFRILLIGEGDQRASLEDDVRRLGLQDRVTLAGPRQRGDILVQMRRARVLAAPCLVAADGNRDALPTVLLEALACGLPVVTTPVNGIPEIVEDGIEGLVVDEGDAEALADGLQRVLRDDLLWHRLSTAGPLKVADRFDRRHTLSQLLDVFGGSSRARETA